MTDEKQEQAKKRVLKITEDNLSYISNAFSALKDIMDSDNDALIKKACVLIAILKKFIEEQLVNEAIEIINQYQGS